ncbi:hypothetical protein [Domibacillus aminovorans]|uniref:Phage protein n=1 Tax=Domibacillus aminovorans TaxID=29332 RepID=A0A177L9K3_9BACI|nr:hypothetical protein [Domibacillus aminovorans]OAH61972.1 hypothetical protein AWH49_11160 [Domibacillus aminovorans]
MNPSLKEQLKQWKKDHQEVKRERKKEKPLQKKQENLSERDWKEIMGMGRARYGRAKGGAFRQK